MLYKSELCLTFEWTMASVSTQTLHPPNSNLTAWWSSMRKRAKTMSEIFCSSEFLGWM